MKDAPIQIVLDTNVLLSALRSKLGASFRLLSLVGDSRFSLNISVPLILEYEDVLKRDKSELLLSHQEIDDVLDFLCQNSGLREIFYLWRPVLDDPKDDFLLELAVESGSDFIVTFNIRDFAGIERFGIKALKPDEFLRIIGEVK
jgi:putative PIN family toxin of toxin-antitoxin system